MRIRNFQVSGYKNLVATVRLDDLPLVTAIYGPNNVGKSNLIEAMALVFVLLGLDETGPLPFMQPARLDPEAMRQAGYPLPEIFTLGAPTAIRLEMDLVVEEKELKAAGILPVLPAGPLSLAIELVPGPPAETWQITRFKFGDGSDIRTSAAPEQLARVRKYSLFLARNYLLGGGGGQRSFQVVGAPVGRTMGGRDVVPPDLALALYDRQESTSPEVFAQFTAFQAMISAFEDIIGAKDVRAVFNRQTGQAQFVVQKESGRMPLRLMGTGVQQLVTLLGTLATSGAHIAAIEEPEANLGFAVQLRLRELIQRMPQIGGPSQILFTSHSPGLQVDEALYALRADPEGVKLSRLPASAAANLTGVVLSGAEMPVGKAPTSWVTEDGLVRLPPFVLAGLGLERGGGVGFIQGAQGTFEILSNETFAERLGWGEE